MASVFLLSDKSSGSHAKLEKELAERKPICKRPNLISFSPSAVKGRRHGSGRPYFSESEGKAPSHSISGTRRNFAS